MSEKERTGLEIAIIGMAGRFPGAGSVGAFWENLKDGVESVSFFADGEMEASGIPAEEYKHPNYVKAKGMLENIETFDSAFFNYTPKEAEIMDPQMRLFHECGWEALEHAGYNPWNYEGAIGLYAGASANFHWVVNTLLFRADAESSLLENVLLNNKDYMATRISYKLNLKGPAVMVQTACSTSLVAVHMAVQSLLMGECEMAMAGGITISLPKKTGYMYSEGMIVSPDGHCRAFDAKGEGFVDGNGIGLVVLKRLEEAEADGDFIHAVILGSAINNDGARRVGYTAPSVEGQAGVIRAALQMAEVEPESIGYIEAHGTGTTLGDPIEIEALKRVFNPEGETGTIEKRCAIGAVKSNVGHMDSAAGVGGLIKAALALRHGLIPPTLHFETPNPKLGLDNSPFYVNNQVLEWQSEDGEPLRAGVSSFGIGGTNAHVVLEQWREHRDAERENQSLPYQLLVLSAQSGQALNKATLNLGNYLKENPEVNLADVAYTLQMGRKAFNRRRMLVCADAAEAAELLLSEGSTKVKEHVTKLDNRPTVFMFTGLGTQYEGMGQDLYDSFPIFREQMDHAFQIVKETIGEDLKPILFPAGQKNQGSIYLTQYSQLIMFIFQYALAQLLMSWGLKPYAMIGYSFGEYVAACISGVFSLEDGIRLVAARSRLIKDVATGAMMSVPLPEKELKPLLNDQLSIAIDNGAACIISGSDDAVGAFEKEMKAKRLMCVRLQASHALHSVMMDSILQEYQSEVARIPMDKPRVPYISNVTGKWITVEDASSPSYWVDHMRKTVRFAAGLEELAKKENAVFIEVGPGVVLSTLAQQILDKEAGQMAVNLLRSQEQKVSDVLYILRKLGRLWLYGKAVDWNGFYKETLEETEVEADAESDEEELVLSQHRRLPLPTYSFDQLPYPVDVSRLSEMLRGGSVNLPGVTASYKFYIPAWKPAPLPVDMVSRPIENEDNKKLPILLFVDNANNREQGLGSALARQLSGQNIPVFVVEKGEPGSRFSKTDDNTFSIDAVQSEHYENLLQQLKQADRFPLSIIYLWGLPVNERETANGGEAYDAVAFTGLINLSSALGKRGSGEEQINLRGGSVRWLVVLMFKVPLKVLMRCCGCTLCRRQQEPAKRVGPPRHD